MELGNTSIRELVYSSQPSDTSFKPRTNHTNKSVAWTEVSSPTVKLRRTHRTCSKRLDSGVPVSRITSDQAGRDIYHPSKFCAITSYYQLTRVCIQGSRTKLTSLHSSRFLSDTGGPKKNQFFRAIAQILSRANSYGTPTTIAEVRADH